MQTRLLTLLLIMAVITGCQSAKNGMDVNLHNPASIDRENEMVEIDWKLVQQKIAGAAEQSIIVTDNNGKQIPFQLVTNGTGSVESLIFPVSVDAGETNTYRVSAGEPEAFEPLVYGRFHVGE